LTTGLTGRLFNDVAAPCDGLTGGTLVVLIDFKEPVYLFQYPVHAMLTTDSYVTPGFEIVT
jgi:hypothetical protein